MDGGELLGIVNSIAASEKLAREKENIKATFIQQILWCKDLIENQPGTWPGATLSLTPHKYLVQDSKMRNN